MPPFRNRIDAGRQLGSSLDEYARRFDVLETLRVQDVMTRRVVTIRTDDSIAQARTKMHASGVHQLVVRDRQTRVVGVITAAEVRDAPLQGCVADFMSRRLVSVRPDSGIGTAAALMRSHAIGSLPVLDGTRLVGIVTVSDMLDVIDGVRP